MSSWIKGIKEDFHKFGTNTIITAMLIYFAQGFRSFGSIAQTLYFKNLYSFAPSDLSLVSSILAISWWIKPFYGLISDCLPIFGYRRKSYIIIAGFIGLSSYLAILLTQTLWISIVALIFGELSQAIADVICDGFIVEKARLDPVHGANTLQRYSWGSLFYAAILGIIIGGNLSDYIDPKYIIGSLMICPLCVTISAFLLDEEKEKAPLTLEQSCKNLSKSVKTLWKEVKSARIIRIICFMILWQSTSIGFGSIFTYYLLDILRITPSTLSYVVLISYIGNFIATFISSRHLIHSTILQRMGFGRMISSILGLADVVIVTKFYEQLGIPYYFFLFGSVAIGNVISMFCDRMPMLIIFTKITPHKIEATFFSLLCSLFNIGLSLSEVISAGIMRGTGINSSTSPDIWILCMISMVVGIASLGFLTMIPDDILNQVDTKELDEETENKVIEEPLISKINKNN